MPVGAQGILSEQIPSFVRKISDYSRVTALFLLVVRRMIIMMYGLALGGEEGVEQVLWTARRYSGHTQTQ